MKREDDYQRFIESIPWIYETASEITLQETKKAVIAIVASETDGDTVLQYISSFKIEDLTPEHKLVRFVPVTEKIRYLERGIGSYSIKDAMLKPGKKGVKMSKEGFLYRSVPISKKNINDPETSRSVSEKEKQINDRIKESLATANFAFKAAFRNKATGEYGVLDTAPGGFVRKRIFDSREDFVADKKPKQTDVIMFRTMSSKPGTSEWKHPGFNGKHLLNKIEAWQRANELNIFNEVVDNLLATFFGE